MSVKGKVNKRVRIVTGWWEYLEKQDKENCGELDVNIDDWQQGETKDDWVEKIIAVTEFL